VTTPKLILPPGVRDEKEEAENKQAEHPHYTLYHQQILNTKLSAAEEAKAKQIGQQLAADHPDMDPRHIATIFGEPGLQDKVLPLLNHIVASASAQNVKADRQAIINAFTEHVRNEHTERTVRAGLGQPVKKLDTDTTNVLVGILVNVLNKLAIPICMMAPPPTQAELSPGPAPGG